jgi:F-type H+-transporting ATPase subunit b
MLEINASLIFIAILVWLLMHILKKLFFDPVLSIINQRYQLTTGVKIEAEKIHQQAQQLLNEYQEKIKQAKIEVYDNIKKQNAILQKQKYDEIQKAKKQTDALIAETISELENYITKISPALKEESKNMALLIANKVLNRDISQYESKN